MAHKLDAYHNCEMLFLYHRLLFLFSRSGGQGFSGEAELRAEIAEHALATILLPAFHFTELRKENSSRVIGSSPFEEDKIADLEISAQKLRGLAKSREGVRRLRRKSCFDCAAFAV